MASIKGHNSGTNVRKMMRNNPNVDLVNMNAYIEFGDILSPCSKIFSGKEILNDILTSVKGHNSSTKVAKVCATIPT